MGNLTKWREAVLSEVDLSPVGKSGAIIAGSKVNSEVGKEVKFYPRKVRKPMKDVPLTVDLLNGYVQDIVFKLNQGKTIEPKSNDHHLLRELLEKINQ